MTRVCVSVCVPRIEEMQHAVTLASDHADIIELRLDCLDTLDGVNRFLSEATPARPLILTLRSDAQGGKSPLDFESRRKFWARLGTIPGDWFIDLEPDLVQHLASSNSEGVPVDWTRVICSFHDFKGVPADLDRIYEKMAATPAGIIKIAVHANDATDCIPVFKLLARARAEDREMIAIAMGRAGVATRVLGPSRESFLTYASPQADNATAPGQTTIDELRNVYRVDRINPQTKVFGIIGSAISHSLSPQLHNAALAEKNLNAVFVPFEVTNATRFIHGMVHPASREIDLNLRGLAVTIPHKLAVMSSLDWLDQASKDIGAVNTVVVRDDQLLGYNTDAIGFILPLTNWAGSMNGAHCAVLGAGGGARAALWALQKEGADVVLFARNEERAAAVSKDFGVTCRGLGDADFAGFDLVVNATPLGMAGALQDSSPATAAQLRGVRFAYDLVYNPAETRFLGEARNAGCKVLGGIEMLVGQAVAQFKLWTGVDPDEAAMRATVQSALPG